jgi:hypothetical protein
MFGLWGSKAKSQHGSEAATLATIKRAQSFWDLAELGTRTSLLKRVIETEDDRLFLAYVHSKWSQIPYSDQMNLVIEVTRRDGNYRLLNRVSKMVADGFSLHTFNLAFGTTPLAEGWTFDDAIAIWYCLGRFCFLVAVGSVLGLREEDALNSADTVSKDLMKIWNMPEPSFKRFLQFNETKLPSMYSLYTSLNDATMFRKFFGLVVSEITGHDASFSVDNLSESFLVRVLEGKEMNMDAGLQNDVSSVFVMVLDGIRTQFRTFRA